MVPVIPLTLLALHGSPGLAKGSELLLVFFMRIPRLRSLRIIPGFYLGFAIKYYF